MFNITGVGQDLDTCIGDTGGADTFVSYRARQKTFPEYRVSVSPTRQYQSFHNNSIKKNYAQYGYSGFK